MQANAGLARATYVRLNAMIANIPPNSVWLTRLAFRPAARPGIGAVGTANTSFLLKTSDIGVTSNAVTASVALPRLSYHGPGNPELLSTYPLRSASSYDWSSFPPTEVTSFAIRFREDVTAGQVAGHDAVGINHAGQADQSNRTFAAGILLGLAGGALLAAVQEVLHLADRSLPEAAAGADRADAQG